MYNLYAENDNNALKILGIRIVLNEIKSFLCAL